MLLGGLNTGLCENNEQLVASVIQKKIQMLIPDAFAGMTGE